MFKQLMEKILRLAANSSAFDPSQFGDPVAMQTSWSPARGGGTNFRTHKLVTINSSRLEFRASLGNKIFSMVFLLAGIGVWVVVLVSRHSAAGFSFDKDTVMALFLGLVFACLGGGALYFDTAPIVFDKREGYFWKGRKAPHEVVDKKLLKHLARLDEIHALQLLSEYCRGSKQSYHSYELNLVLESGRRINVVDHGSCKRLREDAGALSSFLGKPVWDATGFNGVI